MSIDVSGSAFPVSNGVDTDWGMTLRDYFAGQALANGEICTGQAPDYYLKNWFGDRGGITREEIAVRQAYNYADAMIAERNK